MERPIGGTRSPQIAQLGRAASVPHPVGRAARCRREVGVAGRARVVTSTVQEALVGGTRPQPGALVVAAAVPETIVLAELRVDSKGRAATRHSMGARGKAKVQYHGGSGSDARSWRLRNLVTDITTTTYQSSESPYRKQDGPYLSTYLISYQEKKSCSARVTETAFHKIRY